ncbi:MAG: hypothetical protein PHZ24_09900 [Bacteroidales bacterium]|nr:hypothetical protein [Bacteroidales bacterium]
MSKLAKEVLIVSVFVLLVMLAYVGAPFLYIASLLALPIVIGFLFYLGLTSAMFKTEPLQVLFAVYYKTLFIIALFFMSNAYPGKDWFSAIALISAVLYIVFVLIKSKKTDLFVTAIIYINLFCAFLTIVR